MKLIGQYRVLGLLGRGGMGSVYKVRHLDGGPARALKLLLPNPLLVNLMGADEVRSRFLSEAKVMARLSHPNLVTVLYAELACDHPFYVMEHFCNNLGQLIGEAYDLEAPSRALEPQQALEFVRQALAGLDALHCAGIVHRDFKPFNVMLGELDEVKISDLGLSRLRGEVRPGPPTLRIGSPHYAAPEQEADPDSAGPEADLFSLAATLFRLVTGRLPGVAPATILNTNLDAQWDLFFAQSLAPDPGRRFQSAVEMGRAIDALIDNWRRQLGDQCRAPNQWRAGQSQGARVKRLRTAPRKISLKEAKEAVGLDGLWRPNVTSINFEQKLEGLVADNNHGLVWQKGGSGSVMTWPQAQKYVADLNRQNWRGSGDWRLPTVDEAVTLLRGPLSADDICADPVFDPAQLRIWTIDRYAYISAWLVCFDGGYLGRQDLDCHNFVRAVRSIGPD